MSERATPSNSRALPAPLWIEELTPTPDPARLAERLAGLEYRIFLDSAARGGALGRYSFLTGDPVAVVRGRGGGAEILDRLSAGTGWKRVGGNALEAVRTLLQPRAPAPELPPFQGGAAGYVAYEWGRVLEPRLPTARFDDLDLPDVLLGVYDWVLAWDHEVGKAWLISTGLPETSPHARRKRARDRAGEVLAKLARADEDETDLRAPVPVSRSGPAPAPSYPLDPGWWDPGLELRSSFTHSDYLEAVRRVREYILEGDIFQSNLSQRFEVPFTEPSWALYRRLRQRNAAPFAAYLDYPDFAVLSASPERFLRLGVGGRVETRPIKGTRPRGVGPEHDAALGVALVESAKDRAENLMIVDLMRNDLSRVCQPGTVRVGELFALEHYASVHHLVSRVTGQLTPGMDAADLLMASFPGGSITGAPKIRAMEIITELEPSARGVYCGAIGYWSVTGALDMNIAIRTAVCRWGRAWFSAGGGIVADSDPELEYRETLDKARGMIDALR